MKSTHDPLIIPPKLLNYQIAYHRVLELLIKIKHDHSHTIKIYFQLPLRTSAACSSHYYPGHDVSQVFITPNTGANVAEIEPMLLSQLCPVNLIQLAYNL